MKTEYPSPNSISVWIGTFETEDAFDTACDDHLSPKLRLSTDLASICEIGFETKEKRIEELLEGFSGYRTFAPAAAEAAHAKGIQTSNAALVCYYLKCEGDDASVAGLTFLGTFSGTDVSEAP
jgi:hypothetical protein